MDGMTLAAIIIVGAALGVTFAYSCAERRPEAVPFYVLFFAGLVGVILALTMYIAA